MKNYKKTRLVIVVGLGFELPVFESLYTGWNQLHELSTEEIEIFFVCADEKNDLGVLNIDGRVLNVGVGSDMSRDRGNDYFHIGAWSHNDHIIQNRRNIHFFRWFQDSFGINTKLIGVTLSSAFSPTHLLAWAKSLPSTKVYAGLVKAGQCEDDRCFYSFISGANCLLSWDVVKKLNNRLTELPHTNYLRTPFDVLTGKLLLDVPRIPWPFFTIQKTQLSGDNIPISFLKKIVDYGFFQFRVKAATADQSLRLRVDTNTWCSITNFLKNTKADPELFQALQRRYELMLHSDLVNPGGRSFRTKPPYYKSFDIPLFDG
jgi:hypothetical protein